MVTKKESKTYSIIGAAMEVHKVLGCGFSERVYQEALEKEFIRQSIPYERGVVDKLWCEIVGIRTTL